jgi:hypothetical protein
MLINGLFWHTNSIIVVLPQKSRFFPFINKELPSCFVLYTLWCYSHVTHLSNVYKQCCCCCFCTMGWITVKKSKNCLQNRYFGIFRDFFELFWTFLNFLDSMFSIQPIVWLYYVVAMVAESKQQTTKVWKLGMKHLL